MHTTMIAKSSLSYINQIKNIPPRITMTARKYVRKEREKAAVIEKEKSKRNERRVKISEPRKDTDPILIIIPIPIQVLILIGLVVSPSEIDGKKIVKKKQRISCM